MAEEIKPPNEGITGKAIEIPDPDILSSLGTFSDLSEDISLSEATSELLDFSNQREGRLKYSKWTWWLQFLLKIVLFIFVIGLNCWWMHRVLQFVNQSGRADSHFHLSDSVLIALVTTSLANFIALVVIIANHLFPNRRPSK